MHELSIAHAVVATVSRALPEPPPRVLEVHVRVGEMSGVVPHALQFAYDVAATGTPCADALLVLERVPVTVHCPACGHDGGLARPHEFRCASCGAPTGQLLTGRELEVARLVVDDGPEGGAPAPADALVAGGAP